MMYFPSSILIYFVALTYHPEYVSSAVIANKSVDLKNKSNLISSISASNSKYKVLKALHMVFNLHDIEENKDDGPIESEKTRRKRQAGAGKFTEAAKMSQMKTFRLWLQMFKNTWAPVYVGGAHPLHHEIPKIIVYLFKQKVVEKFFPDVGVPDKTQ